MAGRVIDASVLGASFSRAKVCSVRRDPLAASGRWTVEVEEAKSDWLPIYEMVLAKSGMSLQPPILDLNRKRRSQDVLRIRGVRGL